jgi:hypothetical protein
MSPARRTTRLSARNAASQAMARSLWTRAGTTQAQTALVISFEATGVRVRLRRKGSDVRSSESAMTEAELVPEARCVGKVGGGRSEMEMMARAEEGRMRRVPKDFLKISAERRLNESRKKGNQPLDASAEYRREHRLTMLLRSPAPLLGKPPFPFPLLTSIGNLSSTTSPPSLSSPLASLLASRLDPPFASPRQTPSPRFGKAPPEDGTEKAKPVGRLPARECERDREAFGGAIGGECGREGGCCCGS